MADRQTPRHHRASPAPHRPPSEFRDSSEPATRQAIKVLLIEDNDADREQLIAALARSISSVFQVTVTPSLAPALSALVTAPFDAIATKLELADCRGLEICRRLAEAVPDVPIVVLGNHEDERLSVAVVAAGAQDYLVKGPRIAYLLPRAIRLAIERVRRQQVGSGSGQRAKPDPTAARRVARLTPRQREVFDLLVQGKSLKQVSARLDIGIQAATKHRARILQECEVNSDAELVRLMFAAGLYSE